mmetsp:Transcript_22922/g.50138  ORF Transcript_22922/g.50138 Transcript_22922/m.50138 type:complete len:219 (-) Transcript_22922:375-1031(-)
MERTLLLASGFWLGGVAAWAPIAGFLLAPHCRQRQRTFPIRCQDVPTPPEPETERSLALRRPDDPSSLLTESERLRLAPVHSLKRKRRSRKIRTAEAPEEKFVPLVNGARQSVSESIISAYAGESIVQKREAGEDFWLDPELLQDDVAKRRKEESRRKQYKRKGGYAEEKLKQELVSPYKNNTIGLIVVGIAFFAVLLSFFPELLEITNVEPQFPETL